MARPRPSRWDVVLDNASPVLQILESSLDLAPIPGLSLVAKGLSVLLDTVKNVRSNAGMRRAFIDELCVLDETLMGLVNATTCAMDSFHGDQHAKEILQDRMAHSRELQSRMQKLSSTIQKLICRAMDLKVNSGFLGFLEGLIYSSENTESLSDMRETLVSAIQIFQIEGQVSIQDRLSDVIQNAREMRETGEQKILASLSKAAAGYRCVDELKSEFLSGTREELFEDINRWLSDNLNKTPVFFLTGGAGLGKSSIAHQLCTRCDARSEGPVLGASFFFVRGSGLLESTRAFFPTLAQQLAQSQPALRNRFISGAREYLKQGREQQMQHAFEGLFRRPFADASVTMPNPVVVVVDGLDECKERELVPHLLRLLLELTTIFPGIRLFVTSRPDPHVQSALNSTKALLFTRRRSLDDRLRESAHDVGLYIKENVHKMPTYAAFIRDNPSFLERFIARANGVFIFARIALQFLDQYRDHPKPRDQFELLLASGGEGLSALDSLYLQILLSAFPPQDWKAPSRYALLHTFLTHIAVKRRRMPPGAMAFFNLYPVELTKDDIVWMADQLRSVLLIDDEACVVPLHATFAEFLLDSQRCINVLYHVKPVEGHMRFAAACIAAFTFSNVSDFLGAWDHRHYHLDDYISYALGNWGHHLTEVWGDHSLIREEIMSVSQGFGSPVLMSFATHILQLHRIAPYDSELQSWLAASVDAEQKAVEGLKSLIYARLRLEIWSTKHVGQPMQSFITGGRPNGEDVMKRLVMVLDGKHSGRLDLTVSEDHIAQYETALEELFTEIKSARLEKVWFTSPAKPWLLPARGRRISLY